jgi:uncharacterized protein
MKHVPKGKQRWRDLLFLHWSFPIDVVRPLVPRALAIDDWEGRAWVSVIPFLMRDVRLSPMPSGLGLNFYETNVRTYVQHDGVPGIYFFSLEASSLLSVRAARLGWGLPYFHADMMAARDGDRFAYHSIRRSQPAASLHVRWELGPMLGASPVGTLEHFLLERYVLFSFRRDVLLRGNVQHAPYPAQRARVHELDQGLLRAAGIELERGRPADAIHFASGVDVDVFGPMRA